MRVGRGGLVASGGRSIRAALEDSMTRFPVQLIGVEQIHGPLRQEDPPQGALTVQ